MYKLFKFWLEDGQWHTHRYYDYYIAKDVEEVRSNSKAYKKLEMRQAAFGGDVIIIEEKNGIDVSCENLKDFDIVFIKKERTNDNT